jgi:nucleoid-associated protein YgaU
MKQIVLYAVILAAFAGISCQSAPPGSPAPSASSTPETSRPVAQTPSQPAAQPQDQPRRVEEEPAPAFVGRLDMFGAQDYTIVKGDTLSQITRRFYGGLTDVGPAGKSNGFYFPVLVLAAPNRKITDPDLIFAGENIKIPDLKRNLANSDSLQAIKESLIDAADIYNQKGKPEEEQGLLRLANSL